MWRKRRPFFAPALKWTAAACILVLSVVIGCSSPAGESGSGPVAGSLDAEITFETSLHHTCRGLRAAYESADGFGSLTPVSYDEAGCVRCHAADCTACHGAEDPFPDGNEAAVQQQDTCLRCHPSQRAVLERDREAERVDPHTAAGLTCVSCHSSADVHGDGTSYESMQQAGGVTARCEDCHREDSTKAPPYDPTTLSHEIHAGGLDCAACHVRNTLSCYSCHFSGFLESGTLVGNFVPSDTWLLLVNSEKGQVTAGTAVLVSAEGKRFLAYGPYFTHSIMKGRSCKECHGAASVTLMGKGQKVPMCTMEETGPVFWEGVVPAVPEKLEWLFLEKTDDHWTAGPGSPPDLTRWFGGGTSISSEQMEILKVPLGPD